MAVDADPRASLTFGRFRVVPHRRELLADEQSVELGGRAYDVLMALIEAPGAVVSRSALLARAWPGRVVEENALEVQISALRAAFGPDRALIRTVSGRGYQFAGEVLIETLGVDERPDHALRAVNGGSSLARTNLPEPVSELIGRDDELRELAALEKSQRLLTLTGPGGIGKTRLALAVGRGLLPKFPDGVWVADFSPLADPSLVPAAVAAAVGLELAGGEVSAQRVARALADRRLLLVLDTCERVVDTAAELAEALLRAGSGVSIIATSREPLRVEGEQIFAVPPLAAPLGEALDPWEYSAVRLFAVRSRESGVRLPEDQVVASAIATICRQLDGIPLAIELAAARGSTLAITELATRLSDRLNLLTRGRRTALRRHQTLRATLDWSFELLPEPERAVLRRSATFAGAFSLQAAVAIASGSDLSAPDVVDGLANLVEKSLVVTMADNVSRCYRLLDTTRAYALEKLVESGEANTVKGRHAEYYRDLLEAAAEETATIENWPAAYGAEVDNLRAALTWAFSTEGSASIGVALAAASAQLWLELSLLTECQAWMARALSVISPEGTGTRLEMVLQCAFGYSTMFTKGFSDTADVALRKATELAEHFHDFDHQLRSVAALATQCHRLEDFQGALIFGRRAEVIARQAADPVSRSIAEWILGTSLLFLGEYDNALPHAQRTQRLTRAPAVRRAHMVRLGRDGFISASCTAAHIFWAHGLFGQAAQAAQDVLAEAETADHPMSLCTALIWCGCAIPLWLGDLQTAQRSIAQLRHHAQSHDLRSHFATSLCFEGQLLAKQGDIVASENLLRTGLTNCRQTKSEIFYTAFLGSLAEVLMKSGQHGESLAAADEALQRAERRKALWCVPDALRIKGEALLSSEEYTSAAEDHFRRSLDLARRQGALAWELRAAISLGQLLLNQNRLTDAAAGLKPVYDRFTEGFDTADLKTARALLEAVHDLGKTR